MNFHYHPEADQEFIEAVAYYEERDPGLGLDFSREVYATILAALHLHRDTDYWESQTRNG